MPFVRVYREEDVVVQAVLPKIAMGRKARDIASMGSQSCTFFWRMAPRRTQPPDARPAKRIWGAEIINSDLMRKTRNLSAAIHARPLSFKE